MSVALTACSFVKTNEEPSTQPVSNSEFAQFQNDRPKAESVAIGDKNADMTFSAIAGIYGKTVKLTDSYIQKVELSQYSQLTKLSETDPEAYKAERAQMSDAERKDYDEYLRTNREMTEQSVGLLAEAIKLQQGAKDIDVKALVSNPMKLPSALKGADRANDQISFSVNALSMLKKYHDIYSNALSYAGR